VRWRMNTRKDFPSSVPAPPVRESSSIAARIFGLFRARLLRVAPRHRRLDPDQYRVAVLVPDDSVFRHLGTLMYLRECESRCRRFLDHTMNMDQEKKTLCSSCPVANGTCIAMLRPDEYAWACAFAASGDPLRIRHVVERSKIGVEPPPISERAASFVGAVVDHVVSGMHQVPDEVKEERLAICRTNLRDHYRDDGGPACLACGCYRQGLELKASWAEQSCPLSPPFWRPVVVTNTKEVRDMVNESGNAPGRPGGFGCAGQVIYPSGGPELVPGRPAGRSGGDFPGNSSWILSNWILDWIMDTWGWLERMGKQRGSQKLRPG